MNSNENDNVQSTFYLTPEQVASYKKEISALKIIAERSRLLLEIDQNNFNRTMIRINKMRLQKGDPNIPKVNETANPENETTNGEATSEKN